MLQNAAEGCGGMHKAAEGRIRPHQAASGGIRPPRSGGRGGAALRPTLLQAGGRAWVQPVLSGGLRRRQLLPFQPGQPWIHLQASLARVTVWRQGAEEAEEALARKLAKEMRTEAPNLTAHCMSTADSCFNGLERIKPAVERF